MQEIFLESFGFIQLILFSKQVLFPAPRKWIFSHPLLSALLSIILFSCGCGSFVCCTGQACTALFKEFCIIGSSFLFILIFVNMVFSVLAESHILTTSVLAAGALSIRSSSHRHPKVLSLLIFSLCKSYCRNRTHSWLGAELSVGSEIWSEEILWVWFFPKSTEPNLEGPRRGMWKLSPR